MTKKILIVDDEEEIHRVLNRTLKDVPYDLFNAYTGLECLALAEKEQPDLILLDINMPKMDGNETMKELRANKKTLSIPVIMVTGNGESVDRVVGYELGVEDYVTKPFDINNLKRRISDIILGK